MNDLRDVDDLQPWQREMAERALSGKPEVLVLPRRPDRRLDPLPVAEQLMIAAARRQWGTEENGREHPRAIQRGDQLRGHSAQPTTGPDDSTDEGGQ